MRLQICIIVLVLIVMRCSYVKCAEKMDIEGLRKFLKPTKNTCLRKTSVKPELVENVRLKGEFAKDRNLMCFFRCIQILIKIMNKQYVITLDAVQLQTSLLLKDDLSKRMVATVDLCMQKIPFNEDSCLYAFEMAECFYITDREIYFIP